MWQLGRTDTFVRTARRLLKRDSSLENRLATTLALLESDPYDPRLKLHCLRGPLEGLHAVRVTYQIRLILTLDEGARSVTLLDIGTHDEVYR